MKSFSEFFKIATGKDKPFDYQCRLACGKRNEGDANWLSQGSESKSLIINIPTGLGKTAAVVLAWLWNRLLCAEGKNSGWQTRLVYCLPMRTLVEQTEENIKRYLENLVSNAENLGITGAALEELEWLSNHSPVVLMGGEELQDSYRQWDIYPEKPCIIVGTQDMLLSRALNRGYGATPYRWPLQFGLLNVDALWIFDETQLMGISIETSAQIEAFRCLLTKEKTNSVSWWMSATIEEERLKTVDFKKINQTDLPKIKLENDDLNHNEVNKRINAEKLIYKSNITLNEDSKKGYFKEVADFIIKNQAIDGMTLVIVNRVSRAQEIYKALKKELKDSVKVSLIHSRYRPVDRKLNEILLKEDGARIVISTQAVEAGVDCSAKVLISELAPWNSMAQRFGRCNRYGEFNDAKIHWVDVSSSKNNEEYYLPYKKEDLDNARKILNSITSAKITELGKVTSPSQEFLAPIIRTKDIIDLFDTTPDISGLFIDVSRFIRSESDDEVQVLWRENIDEIEKIYTAPFRDELCRVPIYQLKALIDKASKKNADIKILNWDYLDEKWKQISSYNIYPGGIYLLDVKAGGYTTELGWTGELFEGKGNIPQIKPPEIPMEGYSKDIDSFVSQWISLSKHSVDVEKTMEAIISKLKQQNLLSDEQVNALKKAALWHDVGKAHKVFQDALRKNGEKPPDENIYYAKSPNKPSTYSRKFFRHELASALAYLLSGERQSDYDNLIAYLIAAHHGKVRLSIRSMPDEKTDNDNVRIARGIQDGDVLPSLQLDGETVPETKLDLDLMEIGAGRHGASWLERMIKLRDNFGPFKLAYLEALIRSADGRASASYKQPLTSKQQDL
ncbi:MAG TPA: CRISPR-associated helicase Cas3' [Verrucomicrobiota bacterium]|nr:CRISPR-associated helicase Cas3' [Verrucomicrobiota bacterium]